MTRTEPPRHLLVRGVNWLGDAVMTTPALLRLREALPNTRITLLTPAKIAGLWEGHPALDATLSFEKKDSLGQVADRLRALRCDTALILPNSPRSALECWRAGISRRIGFRAPWRNFLLTQALDRNPDWRRMRKRSPAEIRRLIDAPQAATAPAYRVADHQMLHYLHLAACLGADPTPLAPRILIPADEIEAAREQFNLPRPNQSVCVGLNAGAEYGPAKRWPRESFLESALLLANRHPVHWILLGGPADTGLVTSLETDLAKALGSDRVSNVAGRTSLRQLCAVLAGCRALLTNDTGPMHVGAAAGLPVVVPFGSTSPELTGPGLPGEERHRLLREATPCAPCFQRECPIDLRCLRNLAPDRVVRALEEILARDSD